MLRNVLNFYARDVLWGNALKVLCTAVHWRRESDVKDWSLFHRSSSEIILTDFWKLASWDLRFCTRIVEENFELNRVLLQSLLECLMWAYCVSRGDERNFELPLTVVVYCKCRTLKSP